MNHDILLTKLKHFGVADESSEWFRSYISDRSQLCYANGALSEDKTVTCGVPQGSILGPLLFLIFINDLAVCTDYAISRMYADDTDLSFSACSIYELQRQREKDLKRLKFG